MANELQINLTANLRNGYFTWAFSPGQLSVTQTAIGGHCPIASIGTSEEDIATGDIGTLGWLFMRNLDTTNYVTYGPKSGGSMIAFGRLKPGEVAALRLEPGVTIRAQANTSACKVQTCILEA